MGSLECPEDIRHRVGRNVCRLMEGRSVSIRVEREDEEGKGGREWECRSEFVTLG